MGSMDVAAFVKDGSLIAAKFSRDDLGGIFGKKLRVPPGVIALVLLEDGKREVAGPGEEKPDPQEALLVREGDAALDYAFDGLLGDDGRPAGIRLRLVAGVRKEEIDLNLFRRNLLKRRATFSVAEMHDYFEGPLKEVITGFVRARSAKDLYEPEIAAKVGTAVREGLKPHLFEGGLRLSAVHSIEIRSEGYEQEQIAAESLRSDERVEALRKALAFRRAEEEMRLEADLKKQRVDEALSRYEEIRGRLGNDDLKATILLLEDERTKARLIEQLISRDLPKEAREHLEISRLREEMKGWITDLAAQMRVRIGGGGPVQVARRDKLKPHVRRHALKDEVRAF